jgi:hypothetical protein
MMESCCICFKVRKLPNDEWEYIAPELLPFRAWGENAESLIDTLLEALRRLPIGQAKIEQTKRLPVRGFVLSSGLVVPRLALNLLGDEAVSSSHAADIGDKGEGKLRQGRATPSSLRKISVANGR